MPTNDFVTWGAGVGANTMNPATYLADAVRQQGVQAGIASSIRYNTAMRQSSSISSMIGKFIADYQNANVVDDGNVATLETQFIAALGSLAGSLDFLPHFFVGTDTGSADNIQVNDIYPGVTAYNPRCIYLINVGYDNITTTPRMQIGSLGLKDIRRGDQTSCKPFDIQSGEWVMFADQGSYLEIVGLISDFIPSSNIRVFLNSGVFNVPAGVHKVKRARLWAPGGGGGGSNGIYMSSSGGGGGGYTEAFGVDVVPSSAITVTIGASGVGGTGNAYGTAGGTTTFGSPTPVYATGGAGGSPNGDNVQAIGGGGFGGQITANGHYGALNLFIGTIAACSFGGASPFSSGLYPLQVPGPSGGDGGKGTFPGCGGNGAATGSSNTTHQGGDGGDGLCLIEW